ncbi:hypothetical protein YA0599_03355 [Pseudomonas syringae]|uniref:hypothetical protein n=1 Tax=Pseudomonas syringae TaxID=317 RepID=UPI0018E5EA5C|nr:hypothetical protein [Pseudomonas syringae]MBI6707251.1 hypothetical protein [Pseudomonas syringae]
MQLEPNGYTSVEARHPDHTDICVRNVDSGDLVYHCSLHNLPGTDIVYPVSPVIPLSPDHRKALPDIKLRMLEHILHQHRTLLLSAGNETTGGRFSWQTQLEYALGRGYNAYRLTGTQITRFDDKGLQEALARPWTERLPLVLLSGHELPLDADYEIPVDYVHSLDKLDARASLED